MRGKYSQRIRFEVARLKWEAARGVLGRMADWRRIEGAEAGYTVVIGCPAALLPILGANLALLSRQDLTGCAGVVCVVDGPREQVGTSIEASLSGRYPGLRLRFMYYSAGEARVLHGLGYPGGFSWFSWQRGLGVVRTRHALLHDFDAFPLRPGLLRERYEAAVARGVQWLGQRFYEGNGIEAADGLVTTFEMVLDAERVRCELRPIHLFNKIAMFRGRSVEFDTTLHAQTWVGRSAVMDIAEEELVHPSQVVHQYTELTHQRNYEPPARNRLPFLPYLLDVAGEEGVLAEARSMLEGAGVFRLAGRTVRLGGTDPEHVRWLWKQAGLLEGAMHGRMRGAVDDYFAAVLGAVERGGRGRETEAARTERREVATH